MKNNKGITLISVTIYIVVLVLIIGVISNFTKYFYRNTDEIVIDNNTSTQYSKLMSYIIDDINSGNVMDITVRQVQGSNENISYMNLYLANQTIHQYSYDADENKISYIQVDSSGNSNKKIILCNNVNSCSVKRIIDL